MSMIVVSCSSDEPEIKNRTERQEINLDVQSRSISDKISDFHIRFTTDAVKYFDDFETAKNILVSPLSASIALGILANGVDDLTAEQIYSYLGTSDLDALNKLHSALLSELPIADEKSEMTLSNSFWYSKEYKTNSAFKSITDKYYKPEIQSIDFSNSNEVTSIINKWIERNTNGLIKDFNEPISPDAIFAIVDAICFKSVWGREYFSKDNLKKGTFHGLNGNSEVEFMVTDKQYEFAQTEHFSSVRLPFGNGAFSILIVKSLTGNPNFAPTTDDIHSLTSKLKPEDDTLEIPKFKLSSKLDITNVIKRNGVDRLGGFDVKMFNKEVSGYAGKVTQGCSFGIDEEGVEAAAATVITGWSGSFIGTQPTIIRIDQPFYFFITEYSTGACLLSGRIADL